MAKLSEREMLAKSQISLCFKHALACDQMMLATDMSENNDEINLTDNDIMDGSNRKETTSDDIITDISVNPVISNYWCQVTRLVVKTQDINNATRQLTRYAKLAGAKQDGAFAQLKGVIISDGLAELVLLVSNQDQPVLVQNPITTDAAAKGKHGIEPDDIAGKTPLVWQAKDKKSLQDKCDIYDFRSGRVLLIKNTSQLLPIYPMVFGASRKAGTWQPNSSYYFDNFKPLDKTVTRKDIIKLFNKVINYQIKDFKQEAYGNRSKNVILLALPQLAQLASRDKEPRLRISSKELETRYKAVLQYLSQYV